MGNPVIAASPAGTKCSRRALKSHAMDRSAPQRFRFRRICRRCQLLAEMQSEGRIDAARKAIPPLKCWRTADSHRCINIGVSISRRESETPFVLKERTGDGIFRATVD
jgi:hypothetical protein